MYGSDANQIGEIGQLMAYFGDVWIVWDANVHESV
jgi:hypothetical protein